VHVSVVFSKAFDGLVDLGLLAVRSGVYPGIISGGSKIQGSQWGPGRSPGGVWGLCPQRFYDLTINYVQLYLTLLTTDNAIPHVLTVLKSLKFSK